MELCDEQGLLVMSELTDVWRQAKTTYDYARFFDAWVAHDVAAWVRRDRNHPSLILWSVGNEIPDTHMDAQSGGACGAGDFLCGKQEIWSLGKAENGWFSAKI